MAHGVALEQRAIQPRVIPIQDDDFMHNPKTGEAYFHNRAYRRREHAMGDETPERRYRQSQAVRARRKVRRKMARASRRRNR